jgi:DNA-binding IclR family transcriptional regulator
MTVLLEALPVVTASPVPAPSQYAPLPPSMVERMTLILDAFDGRSSRLTLEDVARRTRLPRSTAHRILDQLVKLSWLDHTDVGYELGRRALGVDGAGSDHLEIRSAAAPLLHELHQRTGLLVHLAVLDGAEIHYLDKVGGRSAGAVPSRVGGRAPAHTTAVGKAMLAWLTPEQVDEVVGDTPRRTARSVADLAALHQELHRIRGRRGLSFERGECVSSISCVGAAVRGPQGPVAGISLVGGLQTPLEKVAPLVVDAARQVSAQLFPERSRAPRR